MSRILNKNISLSGKVHRSLANVCGKIEPIVVDDKNKYSEDLLKQLYNNIGSKLKDLLLKYSLGQFDELATADLTLPKYNKFAIDIRSQAKQNVVYYELVRLLFAKTLDGLMQSVNQYAELVDTALKLEKCLDKSSILDDPEKLKAFIAEMQQRRYLFDVEPITVIKSVLKPEYAEYIRLYGVPESFVFDSDLMGEILIKFQNPNYVPPTTDPSQNTVTYPSQNTVTDPSQNPVTDPSQNTITDPSQNTVTDPSQNTVTDPSQNTVTDPSQNTVTDPSQNTITDPSQNTVL
jgi:hypothetical protein